MKFSELFKDVDVLLITGVLEREIVSITEDSRETNEFSAFVIVQGAKYDGMDFLNDARARGCQTFVSDRKFDITEKETLILSKNTRKTLAELSKRIYFNNMNDMTLIGITGTKGKTTTAKILLECLSYIGLPSLMIGTLGVKYKGIDAPDTLTENTTPSATFIYKELNMAYKKGVRFAVIEVSSQALISYRVFGLPFKLLIFTNLSPDHIGPFEHASFEEYKEAKLSLFRDYSSDIFVVNSDDKYAKLFSEAGDKQIVKIFNLSQKNDADFSYEVIRDSLVSVEFSLQGEKFNLPVGGAYNALNASLAVAAAAVLTNKSPNFFKKAISFTVLEGRYEVYERDGVKIIIDFAHNEESMKAICESIRRYSKTFDCEGKVILVFGSVGGRSAMRRKALAKTAEKYADFSYITSDNPGFEDADKICDEIYSYFCDKKKAITVSDRSAAINTAVLGAKSGDFVLLLGKGHEEYQEIGAVKIPFSEKDIIISMGASRKTIKNL